MPDCWRFTMVALVLHHFFCLPPLSFLRHFSSDGTSALVVVLLMKDLWRRLFRGGSLLPNPTDLVPLPSSHCGLFQLPDLCGGDACLKKYYSVDLFFFNSPAPVQLQ